MKYKWQPNGTGGHKIDLSKEIIIDIERFSEGYDIFLTNGSEHDWLALQHNTNMAKQLRTAKRRAERFLESIAAIVEEAK